ncbi:uncharacterized protein K460DRAFT_278097 [Cucurbitaria berberidis CBS 394.84]|uniref:Uncharacterized protein n=1 Tax=Cucurbitaria berberidis CBS 394.84 TaxID=1168544 RepID=A0A9P4GPQ2_9PLEO|nr:uncharacterized protein K460DRAFT_278097 [Cucurbitaria berberidis CBS 394.84]KAF1849136.1 hypothetical protein K460DRAFT_278097 [Cucurbitaria berberidis CBS 394.84]
MSRANQWFVPGDGIAREVITADIQRYLGPDALIRPGVGTGEYQGQPGYWITAYRTLTSQMIQDLKMDSQRWQQERQPGEAGRGVAYQDSRTHAARQHWGPTKPYDQHAAAVAADPYEQPTRQVAPSRTAYATSPSYATSSDVHYTTTPTAPYGSSTYSTGSSSAAPRTQPADPYSAYQQTGSRDSRDPRDYATQSPYSYSAQTPTDPYGRQTAQPSGQYAAPRYFGYFDERFLVYR